VVVLPLDKSPSLSAHNDKLNERDPLGLFWRTCPSDELQGRVLGEDVIGEDLTIQKTEVIYLQDPYGEGLATVFQKSFPRTTVLKPFTVDDAGVIVDLAKLATDADAEDPDAVLVIAVQASDTIAILKELVKHPIKSKKFFFTDGSKDTSKLLDPALPADVKAIIQAAEGTAPAAP